MQEASTNSDRTQNIILHELREQDRLQHYTQNCNKTKFHSKLHLVNKIPIIETNQFNPLTPNH